jgi:hypothetical protein
VPVVDDAVERSDELDSRLQEDSVIINLINASKTNRRLIKWVAASVLFDIGLSIAFGILALSAHGAANRANSAATQAKQNCIAANQSKAIEKSLWDFVLGFPPPPDETAAEKKVRMESTAKFRAHIKQAFAPRDCNHLPSDQSGIGPLLVIPGRPFAGTMSASAVTLPTGFTVSQQASSSNPTPAPQPGVTTSPETSQSPTASPSPSHSPSPSPTGFLCKEIPLLCKVIPH